MTVAVASLWTACNIWLAEGARNLATILANVQAVTDIAGRNLRLMTQFRNLFDWVFDWALLHLGLNLTVR